MSIKSEFAKTGSISIGPLRVLAVGIKVASATSFATALLCNEEEHIAVCANTAKWPEQMQPQKVIKITMKGPVKHDLAFFHLHEFMVEEVGHVFTALAAPPSTLLRDVGMRATPKPQSITVHVSVVEVGPIRSWSNASGHGTCRTFVVADSSGKVKLTTWCPEHHEALAECEFSLSVLIVGASLSLPKQPKYALFQLNLNNTWGVFIVPSKKVVTKGSVMLDIPTSTVTSAEMILQCSEERYLTLTSLAVQDSRMEFHNGAAKWTLDCQSVTGTLVVVEVYCPNDFDLPEDINRVVSFSATHMRHVSTTRNMAVVRATKNLTRFTDLSLRPQTLPPTPAEKKPEKREREISNVEDF